MIDASQVFRDHEILLTGANGFLGKVMLGLLLERFPDFRKLHIVVRSRPGIPARARFDKDVLTSPALRDIAARRQDVIRDRVNVLSGDIAEPLCGLPEQTVDSLAGKVPLVINCAGLVEFFPPVDESFRSNVDGVENIIALTRRLQARLVHVSTCFVCGESDGLVEETEPVLGFYPRRRGPADHSFRHQEEIRYMRERIREVYARAAQGPRAARPREVAQQLIDLGTQRAAQWGWVNIYTYGKSLGEQTIVSTEGLEYAIVRPAIVEAALEFPFPGWVEGGRTAAPLIIMALSGQRHWPLWPEAPLEIVPVDQVATSILIAAAHLLSGGGSRVYQLGTADVNPVKLGDLVEWMHRDYLRAHPLMRIRGGVRILTPADAKARRMRVQRHLAGLQHFVVGLRRQAQRMGLPGRAALSHLGIALRMLLLQASFREQMMELYQPFMFDNRFIFESENIRKAHAALTPESRQLLPWAPESIDWPRYWLENEVRGIQQWVAPEVMKGRTFKL